MLIKDLKDISILCVDLGGHFLEHARRLSRDCKKVYYHIPNTTEASKPHRSYIGHGFKEVELVQDIYGDHFDEADLIYFPDVGMGSLQCEIEQKYGKAVWGSRMAEELELEREATKELFKKIGLPVGPYEEVIGVDALREHLKKHKDVFVKVSRWRGLRETFKSYSELLSDVTLDLISAELGMLKNLIPFIVEEKIEGVELGNDFYTVDGDYPSLALGGIEIKDLGYCGKIKPYKETPKPLQEVNEKLAPVLKKYGMRGVLSTEVRIDKDKIPYVVDLTMRCPSPPGELYQEMYTNYPEIVWKGANGELVDPEPIAEYGVQVNIISGNGRDGEWQALKFPKEFEKNIKLHNTMKLKDAYFIIPTEWHLAEVGAVIGWGDSLKEAQKMAQEAADSIEGESLTIEVKDIVSKAEEQLEKADKLNLRMM
jgi:phosphoribosylamine-glycine ligase